MTAAVCTPDIRLFIYMAFDDERGLLQSELAADYQKYRRRMGMFLPRVSRAEGHGRGRWLITRALMLVRDNISAQICRDQATHTQHLTGQWGRNGTCHEHSYHCSASC